MKQEIVRVINYYFDSLPSSRNGKAVKADFQKLNDSGFDSQQRQEKKKNFFTAQPGMLLSFFKSIASHARPADFSHCPARQLENYFLVFGSLNFLLAKAA